MSLKLAELPRLEVAVEDEALVVEALEEHHPRARDGPSVPTVESTIEFGSTGTAASASRNHSANC